MATPNTDLKNVVSFNRKAIANFRVRAQFAETFDKSFINPNNAPGQSGPTLQFSKPILVTASDGLKANFSKGFKEREATLTVNQFKNIPINLTQEQLVTYPAERSMAMAGVSAVDELVSTVDAFLAEKLMSVPFRWYTDEKDTLDVSSITVSVQALRKAVQRFRQYGSTARAHFAMPSTHAVDIINTALNQFTPDTNDKSIAGWQMGRLIGANNIKFYDSFHLGTHISGSAAGADLIISNVGKAKYTIPNTDITEDVTQLTVTVPKDKTINLNDIGDIGHSTGLQMIRPVGHKSVSFAPQINVVEATKVNETTYTVKLYPALVPPASGGIMLPETNITRAINPAKDKLRLVKTHDRAVAWLHDYAKLAMPPLTKAMTAPYVGSTEQDPESGISLRTYSGFIPTEGINATVFDVGYGGVVVPEGAMIWCLPSNQA